MTLTWAIVAVAFATTIAGRALNCSSHHWLSQSVRQDLSHDDSFTSLQLESIDPAFGGLDFDPKVYANDALFNQYKAKGEHLICLMQATDKGAGLLLGDTREPPSAASKWTGDLKSMSRSCKRT